MSLDYSLALCYGFEINQEDAKKPYRRSKKYPGSFHMEDRFDPKTGAKVAPKKVWDHSPSEEKWVEINGEEWEDLDPEVWEAFFEEKLGCHVEEFGSVPSGDLSYVFYVNKPGFYKKATDYGRFKVYGDSFTQTELTELAPKALELKRKLEELGYKLGEPRVFIALRIC